MSKDETIGFLRDVQEMLNQAIISGTKTGQLPVVQITGAWMAIEVFIEKSTKEQS